MSAAELAAATLRELDQLSREQNLSLLLGAGASVAAGLPDWDTLATQLLQRSGAVLDEDTARAFLARQDPSLAAEAARASVSDWIGLVRSVLYPDALGEPEPAVLHLATAALATSREPGEVGLFTLNFDPLLEVALEDAIEERGNSTEVFARSAATVRAKQGSYEVHHLHGYLGPRDTEVENVILTLSDFAKLGSQRRPWQVAALQDALQRGPLLLAGTSYRDPDVRQWLHELRSDDLDGNEVIALQAREGLGLSRDQFDQVREALTAQWAAINVRMVLVHDHSDAAQAIRELSYLHTGGYLSPSQRATALLELHIADFAAKQKSQSEQLAQDLDELRPHLGDEANLTLWLADGGGQIVRWAAHDRTYRHPHQLRRVPSGHDSAWIAGQCLGRDDKLARDLPKESGTRRWGSVVAAPVIVELPGGPPFATAVLSSAIPTPLASRDLDSWQQALTEVADRWSDRLSDLGR